MADNNSNDVRSNVDVIADESEDSVSAPKKSAAKKSTSKSSTVKPKTASKPKKQAVAKQNADITSDNSVQEQAVEQHEPDVESKVEQQVEPSVEPQAEQAAQTEQPPEPRPDEKPVEKKSGGSFAAKTNAALKSKKAKLPVFIVINSLFLVSAILLMFASYAFTLDGATTTHYNIFQFYANGDLVKSHLAVQAPGWENGAYVMLGILMFLAMLVPLALTVKNIVIAARKKQFDVYNADALVYFGTMIGFIALVNMFGAWLSAGQVVCLIISSVILAFTLLTMLITKSVKQLPFFSLVNIALAFVSLFLLTWKVYYADGNRAWAPAAAAHVASGGGFMFFMLLVSVFALVALVILQMKRFRGAIGHIIEIVVPLAAAVCALIALICAGAAKPDGLSLSVGFVIGAVLTIIIAIADTLFTFIKPLKKYRVMVDDSDDGRGNNVFADAPVADAENAENIEKAESAQRGENVESAAPAPEEQERTAGIVFCSHCGEENPAESKFCIHCGKKL